MKKIIISIISIFAICGIFCTSQTYATTSENILNEETTSQIIEIREKTKKELKDYQDSYGNETYGFTAYILSKIRVYSIPLCFIGIAVGAIWQYVIGIRKLDLHDRGLFLIISFVTIFVICQVLPLIFAIVVKGWRS